MSLGEAPAGSAGFMYFFSIHMGICRAADEVREIRMGGKLGWQGSLTVENVVQINAPTLFGGLAKEGGIQGNFHYLPGEPTQQCPASLATVLVSPSAVTGFRRMVTAFFDGMVSALNPYPKKWAIRARRALKGWDGDVLRPDLAIITLTGPTIPPAADTRPIVRGDRTRPVPLTNVASTVIDSMFGMPFYSIIGVSVNTGTIEDPIYTAVSYETEVIDADTWRFKVAQQYLGRQLKVNYINGTFPGIQNQAAIQVLDELTGYAILDMDTGFGQTITSITLINGGTVTDYVLVTNDPGHAVIHVPAYLVHTAVTVRYMGSITGDFTQVITPIRLVNPAIVDLELNDGETLVALLPGAHSVNAPGSDEPTHGVEAEIIEYEPDQLVAIHDVQAEGREVYIPFLYKPNLGATNLIPDSTIKAMNPAHILFECLTNREWGRGHPRSLLNEPSFEYAAQTFYNEGFGLCLKWNRRDSINTFIQNVLDHVGAVIYSDRSTGLFTLLPIRGDYVKSSLQLWDTTNGVLQIKESVVNGASMLINEVVVNWHDPVLNERRWVNEQNLASLMSQGGAPNSVKKDYIGLPTEGLARRVALRDLKAQSQGLRRFTIVMDRRGWNLTPGKVMRVQDVSRGIPDMVVRIARFQDGTLQNGAITLDVVQDVFSFPAAGFTEAEPPHWSEPDRTPCIGEHEAFELPYYMLVRSMRPADFAMLTDTSAFLGTVAEKGQSINTDYAIAVRDAAPTSEDVPLSTDQLYCGYVP